MTYQPIENYGIIGDMQTVALVGMNGSIDWFCFPYFDSPSVFAAILDDKKGGRFKIAPTTDGVTYKQFYYPETNVLVTRFLSADGVGQVVDYMPVTLGSEEQGRHQIVRVVKAVRGVVPFRVECSPAFNYARDRHSIQLTEKGACFDTPSLCMGLGTRRPLRQDGNGVTSDFTLKEGERAIFVFGRVERGMGL